MNKIVLLFTLFLSQAVLASFIPMYTLSERDYANLTASQQRAYIKAIQKTMLQFEKKLNAEVGATETSLFEFFVMQTAEAATRKDSCLVGGVVVPKVKGVCDTTKNGCGEKKEENFQCGSFFGNKCVARERGKDPSDLCMADGKDFASIPEDFPQLVIEYNQINDVFCEPSWPGSRARKDACGYMQTKMSEFTDSYRKHAKENTGKPVAPRASTVAATAPPATTLGAAAATTAVLAVGNPAIATVTAATATSDVACLEAAADSNRCVVGSVTVRKVSENYTSACAEAKKYSPDFVCDEFMLYSCAEGANKTGEYVDSANTREFARFYTAVATDEAIQRKDPFIDDLNSTIGKEKISEIRENIDKNIPVNVMIGTTSDKKERLQRIATSYNRFINKDMCSEIEKLKAELAKERSPAAQCADEKSKFKSEAFTKPSDLKPIANSNIDRANTVLSKCQNNTDPKLQAVAIQRCKFRDNASCEKAESITMFPITFREMNAPQNGVHTDKIYLMSYFDKNGQTRSARIEFLKFGSTIKQMMVVEGARWEVSSYSTIPGCAVRPENELLSQSSGSTVCDIMTGPTSMLAKECPNNNCGARFSNPAGTARGTKTKK